MDSITCRFDFLDLSTASEAEKQYLEKILYNAECPVTLPYATVSAVPDANTEVVQWSGEQFDEERIEDVGNGGRGPMYHAPCYVYYVPQYPAHPPNQFQYPPEMESQPPPPQQQPQYIQYQPLPHYPQQQQQQRPMGQRGLRKSEKKQEQHAPQQNYVSAPIQMVPLQYSTVFPPGQILHLAPAPVYPDFHSNYPPAVEAPNNGPPLAMPALTPAVAAPPPVPVPVPVVVPVAAPTVAPSGTSFPPEPEAIAPNLSNPPVQLPPCDDSLATLPAPPQTEGVVAAPFHPHEHMCYEETVTLKAPRKKTMEIPEVTNIETAETLPVTENGPAPASGDKQKTWAGLFVNANNAAEKPLARVEPFDSSANGLKMEGAAATASIKTHSSLADNPYIIRLNDYLKNYQLDHKATNITPRGLINHSSWCYVNAILQALVACPTFFNLLRGLPVPENHDHAAWARIPITAAMIELAQCFTSFGFTVRKKWDKQGRDEELQTAPSFEPKGVYRVLEKVRSDSGYSVEGRQEDAEEFLSCLLNGLNDEMLEIMKLTETGQPTADVATSGPLPPNQGDDEQDELQSQQEGWKTIMPRNKKAITRRAVCGGSTPISDIFRGQIRSHVQRAGDDASDSVQPFFTLQLDVEKTQSVRDALELLIGKDPLEGMTCSKTNKEVEAWTSSSIEDLPPILILHLKCFDYKQDGCSKITKVVQFPIDLKIDNKLISSNSRSKYQQKQRNYKLVAVVYHDGKEASKGHYLTDAYHVGLCQWIRYDDGTVYRVTAQQVLNPQSPRVPYLLYYRRTDLMTSTTTKQSN